MVLWYNPYRYSNKEERTTHFGELLHAPLLVLLDRLIGQDWQFRLVCVALQFEPVQLLAKIMLFCSKADKLFLRHIENVR